MRKEEQEDKVRFCKTMKEAGKGKGELCKSHTAKAKSCGVVFFRGKPTYFGLVRCCLHCVLAVFVGQLAFLSACVQTCGGLGWFLYFSLQHLHLSHDV